MCVIPLFLSPSRKRDIIGAIRTEGLAAVLAGELLSVHRLADHTALQQGGGVDRFQPPHLRLLQTGETHSLNISTQQFSVDEKG